MAGKMEVDGDGEPSLPTLEGVGGGLKRCSSAPMINMLMDSSPSTGPTIRHSQDDMTKHITVSPSLLIPSSTHSNGFRPVDHRLRQRHYSTSSLAQPSSSSTASTPVRIPTRIHQLKREEEVNKNLDREVAHERGIQSAMQMSHSWDELTLDENIVEQNKRPRSLSESLHIFTSGFPVASSPSPTRVGKQCFSPSMQAPVAFNGHCLNFTPSPSPSPTRRGHTVRRSLSPIVTLKPSTLSRKRTLDPDTLDSGFSQPKRIFNGLNPLAPTNHLTRNNVHSSNLTTCSFDDGGSEHSSSTGITSMSITNAPSTFSFTPVHDNYSVTTTDSENDMFETITPQERNNNPH